MNVWRVRKANTVWLGEWQAILALIRLDLSTAADAAAVVAYCCIYVLTILLVVVLLLAYLDRTKRLEAKKIN